MNGRSEIRDFLMSRRARISPEQARLPAYGGNRRVPGLRREEVAMLAGVSVDYYIKLERGTIGAVSESVLNALARALQLSPAERAHLFHLTGATASITPGKSRTARPARPAVQWVLDAITDAPAFVHTYTGNLIAANDLGRAVFSPVYASAFVSRESPSTPRFLFLDPAAREFFTNWEDSAADTVANMRAMAGEHPDDQVLRELIDDLNRDSPAFRALWRAHDVRYHDTGIKAIRHPVVGDLTLSYEEMPLPSDPGQSLVVYSAEPGSRTAEAFRLIASWAATVPNQHTP